MDFGRILGITIVNSISDLFYEATPINYKIYSNMRGFIQEFLFGHYSS